MDLDDYAQNFSGYTIPSILVELLAFENACPTKDYYSEGFELIADDKSGLCNWSSAPAFLDRLIPFAAADGDESFYAIWVQAHENLNDSPIVVFGSEGPYHVVASNLSDFLQLISLDVEPLIDGDGIYYCKDEENYEPSPLLRNYKIWLRENANLSSISDNFAAEQIVENAQEEYQEDFLNWINQFIPQRYSYN